MRHLVMTMTRNNDNDREMPVASPDPHHGQLGAIFELQILKNVTETTESETGSITTSASFHHDEQEWKA